MIELLPELQQTVDSAKGGVFRGLHQMILGPPISGKTSQAKAYIEALRQKGASGTTTVVAHADSWTDRDWQVIDKAFESAKGGVIVIDELERASADMQAHVLRKAVLAMDSDHSLVIIVGSPELRTLAQSDPGFVRRMNSILIMPKKFSEDDIEAFRIAGEKAENLKRMAALAARDAAQRLAEWKTAKDEDLRPHKALKAPKTARFQRRKGLE